MKSETVADLMRELNEIEAQLQKLAQKMEPLRADAEAIVMLLNRRGIAPDEMRESAVAPESSKEATSGPESTSRRIVNAAVELINNRGGKPVSLADIRAFIDKKGGIGNIRDERFAKMVRSILSLEVKRRNGRLDKGRNRGFYKIRQEKGAAVTAPQQTSI